MNHNRDNIIRAFKDIQRGLILMDTTEMSAAKRKKLGKLELKRKKLEHEIKTL